MTGTLRIVVTLLVFAATLALVLFRPRRWSEAWWAVAGAGTMLALRLVSPREAVVATLDGKAALLFLFALLLLSLLVGKSGFFEWAAIRCGQFAAGDCHALYRNMFILGALITAMLSLDTTAVILTPIVLALVRRLRLRVLPYIALCALVANVGSLVLPVSNLTNLLFADTFHLTFVAFAARMFAPQMVALAATYGVLLWYFKNELPSRFDASSLPLPASVVPSNAYFAASVAVLVLVLVGYFFAPLVNIEPYAITIGGVVVLLVIGAITGRVRIRDFGDVAWGVFPFVIGLFVTVHAVENLGFAGSVSGWLGQMHRDSAVEMLMTAAVTTAASNMMNNLPAALLARDIIQGAQVHAPPIFAALIGADVGPIITPFGSLATMLVIALARREDEAVSVRQLVAVGLILAPILVVLATLTLAVTFMVAQ